MRDDVVAFMGIGCYREPSGITRAIQILIDHLASRAVLVVDDLDALRTHPIRKGHLYKFRKLGSKKFRLFREPYKLTSDVIHSLIDTFRILSNERVHRICCNSVYQFRALAPLLILIRFLRQDIKISVLIYDPSEVAWCQENLLIKLLLGSRFTTDIVTVDTSMQQLIEPFSKATPIHVLNFGVSFDVLGRAHEALRAIRGRVGPNVPHMLSKEGDSVILLFYGRIIPRRRLEDLIVAFSSLLKTCTKKIVLYVGGYTHEDVPYLTKLKVLAAELKCYDQTRFFGTLTSDELAYLYHCCDIFVFPAVQQPWGLAPLEAMAFGKPVIITDGCGLAAVLKPRGLALVAEGRNSDDLAEKIESLVNDEHRRHDLGEAGRAFVEQNLTYENTGVQLEKFWRVKSGAASHSRSLRKPKKNQVSSLTANQPGHTSTGALAILNVSSF
jgi:glycosyltransferase involved in cell wall biosynthesis